jgi:hypothetical protein
MIMMTMINDASNSSDHVASNYKVTNNERIVNDMTES